MLPSPGATDTLNPHRPLCPPLCTSVTPGHQTTGGISSQERWLRRGNGPIREAMESPSPEVLKEKTGRGTWCHHALVDMVVLDWTRRSQRSFPT